MPEEWISITLQKLDESFNAITEKKTINSSTEHLDATHKSIKLIGIP